MVLTAVCNNLTLILSNFLSIHPYAGDGDGKLTAGLKQL